MGKLKADSNKENLGYEKQASSNTIGSMENKASAQCENDMLQLKNYYEEKIRNHEIKYNGKVNELNKKIKKN